MKKAAAIVAALALPLAGCRLSTQHTPSSAPLTGPARAPASAAPASLAAGHCHSVHGLPDRHCTPGATYAKVTQRTIGSTICVQGWTATVRPPESYTEDLKREMIAAYGYSDTSLGDYEEDHLIPLELGGSPRSVPNLWPQYDRGVIPNPKDKVEDALRAAVCDGRVTLKAAQRAIARNWQTAEQMLGLGGRVPAPAGPPSAPAATAPAGVLSCSAAVSDAHPADHTTVHVSVRTAAGARVSAVAHYKTTSHQESATADGRGRATVDYDIGSATKGYRVQVDVSVSAGSARAHCVTAFTPA